MGNSVKTRIEHDLLGEREMTSDKLYGIQTLRGIENFNISNFKLSQYPLFINGLAYTKMAAAYANHDLGLLTEEQFKGICAACKDLLDGKFHDQFPVDMIQGGAFTVDGRYVSPRENNQSVFHQIQVGMEHFFFQCF